MNPINSPYMMRMGEQPFYEARTQPKYKKLPVMDGYPTDPYSSPQNLPQLPPLPRPPKRYMAVKMIFMIAMIIATFWFLYLVSEGYFKSTNSNNVDQPIENNNDIQVFNNETTNQEYQVDLNATVPVTIQNIYVNCYEGGCNGNHS